MDDRAGLGRAGEKQAVRFLRRLRYRIVTQNYRCSQGEIDVIALDGKTIVFVEVKTRTDRDHADPQDAVNRAKQAHIVRAARFFLRQTGSEHRECRFDIVAIVRGPDGSMAVEHIADAFSPGG
jgi:putative endonuclease